MGQIRTRSSDIKKRLAERREKRKKEKEGPDSPPKRLNRGKSEHPSKTEIVVDGIDITGWPTRADASRMSGISISTLTRLQNAGDLEAIQDETGAWRFNPDDLNVIAESRSNDAAAIMTETVGTVVRVSQEQAAQGLSHAKDFAELQMEHSDAAWNRMLEMSDRVITENDSLRERVKELETERKENLEYIEKAQGKMHEREKEKDKEKRLDDRIDWALKTVVGIAGPSIMLKLGLNPASGAPLPTPGNTIGALLEKKEEAPKSNGSALTGEITIEKLEELNMSALLLIANIDEARFRLLCHVATPEEIEALTEVRETVAKIRANKEKPHGESSTTQGT